MPTLEELVKFAQKIEKNTGYKIKLTDEKSRVVMLVRDEEVWEWNLKLINEWRKIEEKYDAEWKGKVKDFKLRDYYPDLRS